jgi:hypothetical protein
MTASLNLRFHSVFMAGLFLATYLIVWSFLGSRALPWWTDGGLWLKYANGLMGVTWPLWDEKPLNYPPLFPSILALFTTLTNDPVFSVKFLAAFLFSIRPLAAYLSSLLIFREKLSAIAAALIMMFLPIHVEMVGWGGYPNILGLSLSMISVGLLISWLRDDTGRMLPALFITSGLISISHNLTFLVYSATLTITLVSLFLTRKGRKALKVLSVLLFSVGVYVFYVFAFLWPPSYSLHNEAAYHQLRVNLSSGFLTWIFKSVNLLLTLYALTAVTIGSAILLRKRLLEVGVLTCWLITPLLLINLHVFGIALDYQRVFLFFVDPFILLAAASFKMLSSTTTGVGGPGLAIIREWVSRFSSSRLGNLANRLTHLLIVAGLVAAIFLSSTYGLLTFKSVNEWYNFRDKYGDAEKLEALEWIKSNIASKYTVVAEEEIARWIEGYGSRRVLMYAHPMYLFINGEQQRAYIAKTILLSSVCLNNNAVAIYETHNPRENMSTRIAVRSLGALEEIFFLETNSSYIEGSQGTTQFRKYLSDAKSVELIEDAKSIRVIYGFEWFVVDKHLSINSENGKAQLSFKVKYLNSDILLNKLVIELKSWPARTIWEIKVKPNGTLLLKTDIGEIVIETNSLAAFPFVFDPNREATISLSSAEEYHAKEEANLLNSKSLLKDFNAKFIVVPRLQETQLKRNIQLKPLTKPEYMHLLGDPSYRIAYENERVIILEFIDR